MQHRPAAEAKDTLNRMTGPRRLIGDQRLLHFTDQISEHGRKCLVNVAQTFRQLGGAFSLLGLSKTQIELLYQGTREAVSRHPAATKPERLRRTDDDVRRRGPDVLGGQHGRRLRPLRTLGRGEMLVNDEIVQGEEVWLEHVHA